VKKMANEIEDGGPAFPCATDEVLCDTKADRVHIVMRGGMSLRDYFAAAALTGTLTGMTIDAHQFTLAVKMCETTGDAIAEHIANECYAMADAMLAQRKKGQD
jgi:hypothetical protein